MRAFLTGFFLVFVGSLFAIYPDADLMREADPSGVIHHVSVVDGSYSEIETDLMLSGPDSIGLRRFYSSHGSMDQTFGGWTLSSETLLFVEDSLESSISSVLVGDRNGSFLRFQRKDFDDDSFVAFEVTASQAICNTARGAVSKWTNVKNYELRFFPEDNTFVMYFPFGGKRIYKSSRLHDRYLLEVEELPTGNRVFCQYDSQDRLCEIRVTDVEEKLDMGWIRITYGNEVIAVSSDQKRIEYHFTKPSEKLLLTRVKSAEDIDLTYQYVEKGNIPFLHRKVWSSGRYFEVQYGVDAACKVESISYPFGQEEVANVSFKYSVYPDGSGDTEVLGPDDQHTRYRFDTASRLNSIEEYLEGNPYRIKRKEWGEGKDLGNLLKASVEDAHGNIFYCQSFTYDDLGNILECREYGNFTGVQSGSIAFDEQGNPKGECHLKKYQYFAEEDVDVIREVDENASGLEYRYNKGTSQLFFKGILEKGQIKKQHFYRYKNGVLDRVIIADGDLSDAKITKATTEGQITLITPREKCPNFGAPEVIEEKVLDPKSQQQILTKKTINRFNDRGLVTSKEVYGSEEQLLYTTHTRYDNQDRIALEIDPKGKRTSYRYDDFSRLIQEESSGKVLSYQYDLQDRVIGISETHLDEKRDEIQISFNAVGNKLVEKDFQGTETRYCYDSLGRLTSVSYPEVVVSGEKLIRPEYSFTYDLFDHPISTIDPEGNQTTQEYNVRGKPIRVNYPDGRQESFQYRIAGNLWKHEKTDGTTQTFEYDPLGRVTDIHYYETESSSSGTKYRTDKYRYNAFHLVSKDEDHCRSFFEYDLQGRLSKATQATNESIVRYVDGKIVDIEDGQTQEFSYDPSGRVESIKKWKTPSTFSLYIQSYDLSGQLAEERIENERGETLYKKRFLYNELGQLSSIIGYPQNEESRLSSFEYDHWGRVFKKIDATGAETSYDYNEHYIDQFGQKALLRIVTDPMGNQTQEVINSSGSLVQQVCQDANGVVLSNETYGYNIGQRLMSEQAQSLEKSTYCASYSFSPSGRLEKTAEGSGCLKYERKSYLYDSKGRLSDICVPGFEKPIHYEYEYSGNLQTLSYNDPYQTNIYQFSRDAKEHISEISFNGQKIIESKFDESGQILCETYSDKFGSYSLEVEVDGEGCITKVILPDGSFIKYSYNGPFVEKIVRHSPQGKKLYHHEIKQRNWMGQPVLETLAGSVGEKKTAYDRLGRKIEVETEIFSDRVSSFDRNGNLLEKASASPHRQSVQNFNYDALSRLTSEQARESYSYEYDSLGNWTSVNGASCEVNGLNQLRQLGDVYYEYDANGNLRSKVDSNGKSTFQFDALGRLTSVQSAEEVEAKYTYDASGRRLTKQILRRDGSSKTYRYFYLGTYELGSVDENGQVVELRLPINPNSLDNELMVAIEVDGRVFVPIQDIQGNVRCLVDPDTKEIVETYEYTAFGMEKIFDHEGSLASRSEVKNPWRYLGKRTDPETGLIYFGQRFYDPNISRWISPDPLGSVDGLNLYTFVHNNPFQYIDHLGLAAEARNPCVCGCCVRGEGCHCSGGITSHADQCRCLGIACSHENRLTITSAGMDLSTIMGMGADTIGAILSNPHFHGSMQAFGGLVEAGIGGGMTYLSGGIAAPIGWPVMAHGLDQFFTGVQTAIAGEHRDTVSSYLLQQTGVSRANANFTNDCISVGATAAGTALIQAARLYATYYRLPAVSNEVLGGAYNRATFEEYKALLRSQMQKPKVVDSMLRERMGRIYRPNSDIGNGSTAAAIRYEKMTGNPVRGKMHAQKGHDLMVSLERWLTNHPTAASNDRAAVENIILDLRNALGE